MNRETIKDAAICNAIHCTVNDERFDEHVFAFMEGANWRVNSVWHDASEKYEIRLPSVVVFKNGRAAVYLDLRDVTYDGLWDEVKEYAYLKDLHPDRKEDER